MTQSQIKNCIAANERSLTLMQADPQHWHRAEIQRIQDVITALKTQLLPWPLRQVAQMAVGAVQVLKRKEHE